MQMSAPIAANDCSKSCEIFRMLQIMSAPTAATDSKSCRLLECRYLHQELLQMILF
jgi:hypothetical protein